MHWAELRFVWDAETAATQRGGEGRGESNLILLIKKKSNFPLKFMKPVNSKHKVMCRLGLVTKLGN